MILSHESTESPSFPGGLSCTLIQEKSEAEITKWPVSQRSVSLLRTIAVRNPKWFANPSPASPLSCLSLR